MGSARGPRSDLEEVKPSVAHFCSLVIVVLTQGDGHFL